MIHVDRTASNVPPSLRRETAHRASWRAAEFFNDRSRALRQRQHEFDRGPLEEEDVRSMLVDLFSSRCAFCGCGEDEGSALEVHRFRPPQDAVAGDGETSRRHYWWIAYDWANLYLACAECSRAQGSKFPVAAQRARVNTSHESLLREEPLLLDPCGEDPEQSLVYLDTGELASSDPRGSTTIETFELNRPSLLERRRAVREKTRGELRSAHASLEDLDYRQFVIELVRLYDRSLPFAALRRQLANQWAQVRPRRIEVAFKASGRDPAEFAELVGGLRRVTQRVKAEAAAAFFGRPLPLRTTKRRRALLPLEPAAGRADASLDLSVRAAGDRWSITESAELREVEIGNFRAIDRLRLRFDRDAGVGSWLMLLGENATGKSSVLQAIALALAGDERVREFPIDYESLLRDGEREGFVRVRLTGSRRERELRFERDRDSFRVRGYPGEIVVAGYGSSRLLPRNGGPTSISGVEGLFDPFIPLADPAAWLPEIDDKEFDAIARALRPLLNLEDDDGLRRTPTGVELIRRGRRHPLSHLSDGYQAMAGFGLDLMRVFIQRWGSIEAAEGIVLVDELGTHLHPRWQMKVTGSLRQAFPRVQFIATTHDPLCLRGLEDGEVAVLHQSGDKSYVLQDDLPPVSGLAVDQLLTSEHFGLGSTMDPGLERLFEEYYALRTRHDLGEEESERLRELSVEFEQRRLLGATMRERLAYEAVDDFIADSKHADSASEYYALKAQTRQVVARVWKEPLA